MSDDRQKSGAFAQHRRERGFSRLRESRRLGAIGKQGKSWSVAEASNDAFSGFFYSLVGRRCARGYPLNMSSRDNYA